MVRKKIWFFKYVFVSLSLLAVNSSRGMEQEKSSKSSSSSSVVNSEGSSSSASPLYQSKWDLFKVKLSVGCEENLFIANMTGVCVTQSLILGAAITRDLVRIGLNEKNKNSIIGASIAALVVGGVGIKWGYDLWNEASKKVNKWTTETPAITTDSLNRAFRTFREPNLFDELSVEKVPNEITVVKEHEIDLSQLKELNRRFHSLIKFSEGDVNAASGPFSVIYGSGLRGGHATAVWQFFYDLGKENRLDACDDDPYKLMTMVEAYLAWPQSFTKLFGVMQINEMLGNEQKCTAWAGVLTRIKALLAHHPNGPRVQILFEIDEEGAMGALKSRIAQRLLEIISSKRAINMPAMPRAVAVKVVKSHLMDGAKARNSNFDSSAASWKDIKQFIDYQYGIIELNKERKFDDKNGKTLHVFNPQGPYGFNVWRDFANWLDTDGNGDLSAMAKLLNSKHYISDMAERLRMPLYKLMLNEKGKSEEGDDEEDDDERASEDEEDQ